MPSQNITHTESGTAARGGGAWSRWLLLGSVFAGAGTLVVARRRIFPRQQDVLTSLLPLLRAEPEVRHLIGSKLVPGTITTLKHHYWGRSLSGWNARSVELRMVVRGEVSRASVKVSAGKNKNRLVINSVLVELPNGEFLRL
ncbi:uncharacterized protein LOC135336076 [Halichondria panicea]|uniref:uncharacterized protein LOC135336076 n=1 Tax=Halichondria panicea TaxID=6063 RepID=UPI00312B453D